MKESAKSLGYQVSFFPAEPFLLPHRTTPEHQYRMLDDLVRQLIDAKPHLVIVDDLCARAAPARYISPEVYRNVFVELRERLGFKLVAFYPDPWMKQSLDGIEFTIKFVDLVWHQNVALAQRTSQESVNKFFPAPIPYPEHMFRSCGESRTIAAGFLGSVFSYNYLRAIWCTAIKSQKIPCQLFIAKHVRNESPAGDTIQEYVTFMSRVRVMVNFSARNPGTRIITGRVWESILSKALLLEEDNDEITHYFTPFVHYIPFKNIAELESYVRFFERREDVRHRIVEEAYEWHQRRYSQEKVWNNLIEAAFSGCATNSTISQRAL